MDFSREVGGVVVKIVKIIEGLEDELWNSIFHNV